MSFSYKVRQAFALKTTTHTVYSLGGVSPHEPGLCVHDVTSQVL